MARHVANTPHRNSMVPFIYGDLARSMPYTSNLDLVHAPLAHLRSGRQAFPSVPFDSPYNKPPSTLYLSSLLSLHFPQLKVVETATIWRHRPISPSICNGSSCLITIFGIQELPGFLWRATSLLTYTEYVGLHLRHPGGAASGKCRD